MMKLTNNQLQDLETIKYFMLPEDKMRLITDEDIRMFFEYSEQGKHRDKLLAHHYSDGFNTLVQGKIWRGRHMEIYEEGILDGTMPYIIILEGAPRQVVDFMKRELFKGRDAELIENVYGDLTNSY